MKSSIPVNCPWRSARSSCMTTVHFRPLIGGPVLSLHVRAPFPVPRWPLAKGPACSGRDLPSWWTAVGSARFSHEAPICFLPQFLARFSPCAHSRGWCYMRWGGQPFWWANQCSEGCLPPPRSSSHGPWPPFLHIHPDCNVPGPPHVMLRTQAVGMKSLQAAEQPADLAPVRWQATGTPVC